jgi:CRP-like cAMP-binding protein
MIQRREYETITNRILLALPAEIREEILCACHSVEFPLGHVFYRAGATIDHLYFINEGLVSLLKTMADGRSAEIGAVGIEGLAGMFAGSGSDHAPADYVVQVPVAAYRIQSSVLQRQKLRHAELRELLRNYRFLLRDQLAQVSACNRLHTLEQRCCHWLLVAHDNVGGDEFPLTHEFFASLLGVQRPSLSMTANGLQKRGLITYRHGRVTIFNRAALEECACECYHALHRKIDTCFDPEPFGCIRSPEKLTHHENFTLKLSVT